MLKLKTFFLSIFALTLLSVPLLTFAEAPIFKDAGVSLKSASTAAELGDPSDFNPSKTVANIINLVIGVLGVAAVILVIYAGGLWLTAAGSDEKVGKAKKILQSAVIGIVIISLAYAITSFMVGLATG